MLNPPAELALAHLRKLGYALLTDVFSSIEVAHLAGDLSATLNIDEPSVLRSRGQTYGSRDLLRLMPALVEIPRQPLLREFLVAVLGPDAGLVRALYFDKPPERSWSLPWHKDRTIAVKDNAQGERLLSQADIEGRHPARRGAAGALVIDAHVARASRRDDGRERPAFRNSGHASRWRR